MTFPFTDAAAFSTFLWKQPACLPTGTKGVAFSFERFANCFFAEFVTNCIGKMSVHPEFASNGIYKLWDDAGSEPEVYRYDFLRDEMIQEENGIH